jgi:hypothetical protein
MSTAKVDSDGLVTVLDGRAEPEDVVTEEDVKDTAKLARILARLLSSVAILRRRFAPRRIDFEDVTVSTAGASVSLQHGFPGRVRWYVCGWQSAASTAPYLREDTDNSTDQVLVLLSYVAGTVCVRVEEAG